LPMVRTRSRSALPRKAPVSRQRTSAALPGGDANCEWRKFNEPGDGQGRPYGLVASAARRFESRCDRQLFWPGADAACSWMVWPMAVPVVGRTGLEAALPCAERPLADLVYSIVPPPMSVQLSRPIRSVLSRAGGWRAGLGLVNGPA